MMKATYMVIGALLVIGAVAYPMNNAYAGASVTAVGSPYNLGDKGKFNICVDAETTINYAALFRPDSTLAWQTNSWTVTIPANGCIDVEPGNMGFGGFDQQGTWVFIANDADGNQFLFEFVVSFFVLPESPIGAVAIIGSSIAAIGAFMTLKRRVL